MNVLSFLGGNLFFDEKSPTRSLKPFLREFLFLISTILLFLQVVIAESEAATNDFTGYLSFEGRGFYEDAAFGQNAASGSIAFEPEYIRTWSKGRQTTTFKPFLRLDSEDDERTHFDIRQLDWTLALRDWEFRVGLRKVFWGVTEAVHLVDVINQTDFVEDFDGEEKLGQPMVNVSWIQDFGTFDFFILPYFRKRTHAGIDGRLRFALPVDNDKEVFESANEEKNIDWAARYYHSIGAFDIGLSYFQGTSREPRYVAENQSGNLVLVPNYDLIKQFGFDGQWTYGGLLAKFELIRREGEGSLDIDDPFTSYVAGFEYTFNTVFDSSADWGVIVEYIYDDRGSDATTPFENDIFLGTRFALNDEDDFQILAGVIADIDSSVRFVNIEASRRGGDHWQFTFKTRIFLDVPDDDFLFGLKKDSYSQVEAAYYF